ncbi:alpha-2-glucosyltransferase Alg10 [Lipomyces japonicus]|uniref:alpha-2-glucosyltransferase Alg10 n=1 Tax=Lipomyces japonicus TaxID=56871 RepID=UPI0034CE6F88
MSSILLVASTAIFAYINKQIPDPYLDEIFHIPQTQQYCAGNYSSWDGKITTPPGLYMLAKVYACTIFASCNVNVLRSFNLLGQAIMLPLVLHRIGRTNGNVRHVDPVILQLMPVFYFFSFLYYTDVWSTIFAITLFKLSLSSSSNHASDGHKSCLIKAVIGILSISLRQTNIIWVGFAFAVEIGSLVQPVPVHRIDGVVPFLAAIALASLQLISKYVVRRLPRLLISYAPPIIIFIAVLVYNQGSITFGDKSNHTAGIHVPQVFYFSGFATFLAWPILLPQFLPALVDLYSHPRRLVVALSTVLAAVYFTTRVHPFLLADNRHYTFYVFRRILSPFKYALVPVHVFTAYVVFVRSFRAAPFLPTFAFALATAAVLVPSPLIECRYFIVPYLVWRCLLHQQGVRKLVKLEIAWYVLINIATLGLFVGHSFEWPSEPGIPQRFMW